MSRWLCVLGILAAATLLLVGDTNSAPVPGKLPTPKDTSPLGLLELVVAEFPEVPKDPQAKLEDVLTMLTEKLKKDYKVDLTFEINRQAFAAAGLENPGDSTILANAGLPRKQNLPLSAYLRLLLKRLQVGAGVVHVAHRDHIEITTADAAIQAIWGPHHKGPFLPLVHVRFEKKPLEDALKELAEQSEHNVLLDPKVGDKAQTAVTARLMNAPLDTAVTMLADMAELQSVLQDNVIFVTTRENALRWESRNRKPMAMEEESGPRIGPGLRGVRVMPAAAQ